MSGLARLGVCAALLAVTFGLFCWVRSEHARECHALGGHLESHTGYKTVTWFCLSSDGRLLRVW